MNPPGGDTAPGRRRSVGILGGMGPEATVDLMRRVIALTPAEDDRDHVRMFVDNNPQVPSRIEALIEGTGPSPAPVLVEMARGLAIQGADFLVMPCNTAHHYHGTVAAAVSIPFLNLMELVADYLPRVSRATRVGLLASSALRIIALYEPALAARGLTVVYPHENRQNALMDLIRAVKAGRVDAPSRRALPDAADSLIDGGAEILLVACTELSVLADTLETRRPLVDAADILARAVLRYSEG